MRRSRRPERSSYESAFVDLAVINSCYFSLLIYVVNNGVSNGHDEVARMIGSRCLIFGIGGGPPRGAIENRRRMRSLGPYGFERCAKFLSIPGMLSGLRGAIERFIALDGTQNEEVDPELDAFLREHIREARKYWAWKGPPKSTAQSRRLEATRERNAETDQSIAVLRRFFRICPATKLEALQGGIWEIVPCAVGSTERDTPMGELPLKCLSDEVRRRLDLLGSALRS